MKLSNSHNKQCKELIEPAILNETKYDFDRLCKLIYPLFNSCPSGHINMWYTLILAEVGSFLFFGFTQEHNKPKIGEVLEYRESGFRITRIGRSDGHHGWCKLIIVEAKEIVK